MQMTHRCYVTQFDREGRRPLVLTGPHANLHYTCENTELHLFPEVLLMKPQPYWIVKGTGLLLALSEATGIVCRLSPNWIFIQILSFI